MKKPKDKVVLKVQRLLAKGKELYTVRSAISACVLNGRDLYVLLPRDRWAGVKQGEDASGIYGQIGCMYNTKVYDALTALVQFKLITYAERTAFLDWLREAEDERMRDSDIEKMRTLAIRHGYTLTKKTES